MNAWKALDEKTKKIIEGLDDSEHIEVDVVGAPKMNTPKKRKKKTQLLCLSALSLPLSKKNSRALSTRGGK